ncbi:MAG: heavy metal translocating P-type ATPase metal-binding domain-containing protein, partial [Steroidobacterales bacterium]
MDAGILSSSAPAAQRPQNECYHCGLSLSDDRRFRVTIDGVERALCCAGCQAVAQIIVDHGLISYYRHRSALPARGQTVPPAVRELAAYDVPEVERALTRDAGIHVREAALMLTGITCSACVWLIEQRLARVPGVLGVDINYATHRAQVRWDTHRTRLAAILGAVAALGYRAYPYDSARAEQARSSERDRALRRLFVAGFGMMQVMMY